MNEHENLFYFNFYKKHLDADWRGLDDSLALPIRRTRLNGTGIVTLDIILYLTRTLKNMPTQ